MLSTCRENLFTPGWGSTLCAAALSTCINTRPARHCPDESFCACDARYSATLCRTAHQISTRQSHPRHVSLDPTPARFSVRSLKPESGFLTTTCLSLLQDWMERLAKLVRAGDTVIKNTIMQQLVDWSEEFKFEEFGGIFSETLKT